mmetsp:Transcript_33817/g.24855  ORF Transcript_33817/g.24855 Transcript_33817/m.24855 type:complete len:293 (-) Transcript_33817:339-1217(-)|eukprot:CAMPEP_0202971104 /NCGR_PEP_ID=MMETSP1396-20130829/23610_1 /ASSEMBLY_ACC=CAM_ASM_000872 /TAXON_ID= /ORGANISM="Pseudokeronopsis sp., Strain Brazil" /LENGTH=292 /DNA_ID=CAMNT_0049700135 /DNA_START=36 /DNA_END=914 /DNA_ORIENTATION=-
MRVVLSLLFVVLGCLLAAAKDNSDQKHRKLARFTEQKFRRGSRNYEVAKQRKVVKPMPIKKNYGFPVETEEVDEQSSATKQAKMYYANKGYIVQAVYSDNDCSDLIEVHAEHLSTCDRFNNNGYAYSAATTAVASFNRRFGRIQGHMLYPIFDDGACEELDSLEQGSSFDIFTCMMGEGVSEVYEYENSDGHIEANIAGVQIVSYENVNTCMNENKNGIISVDIYAGSECYSDEGMGYFKFGCESGKPGYYTFSNGDCSGSNLGFTEFLEQDYCTNGNNAVQYKCSYDYSDY